MPSKSIQDALNDQIKEEFTSAYQYLAMSAYCEASNLPGFASWMRTQAAEEMQHALKIYDFILNRNAKVVLQAIAKPEGEFKSILEVFEKALKGEQNVTELINRLYALAVKEHDYASQVFLNWFVDEQVEEEKITSQVVDTLRMVGDNKPALIMLDRELGQRRAEEQAT